MRKKPNKKFKTLKMKKKKRFCDQNIPKLFYKVIMLFVIT